MQNRCFLINMKYKYIIIILTIFISCEKDKPIKKPIVENNDCIEIPPSQSIIGYDYTIDTNSLALPCFNPNNGNELLFVHQKYSNGSHKLYKYNLVTKNKKLLVETEIYSQPNWATNNWILLGLNHNIYKIKSNGDSLIQITNNGGNSNPVSNFNSNKFICSNTSQNFYIYDFSGNIIDTLTDAYVTATFDWDKNDNILIPTYEGIYMYNYNLKTTTLYCDEFNGLLIGKGLWINDTEFIWSTDKAIYKTNISNNNTICLKSHCNAFRYFYPSYSKQSNKIIWQKVKKKKTGENLIEVKSVLVLMDTDGTNEQEIEVKNHAHRTWH